MKKLLMTTIAILVTGSTYADVQSSNLNKGSDQLKKLGSAFKHHSTTTPKIDPNDITMGYAGQDVVNRTPVSIF